MIFAVEDTAAAQHPVQQLPQRIDIRRRRDVFHAPIARLRRTEPPRRGHFLRLRNTIVGVIRSVEQKAQTKVAHDGGT